MSSAANESTPDADDVLRALRPYGDDGYLEPGDDLEADALLRHVTSGETDKRHMARRARRVAILVTGLTVAGAGAAAAMIVTRSPHDTTVLSCLSSADPQTATQVLIVPDTRRTPVEQCADLWSDGRLSSGGAPHLVACVTDTYRVAVVPGDSAACVAAGWGLAASPPTAPITDRTAELTGVLSDRFVDQCMDSQTATTAVEDVLVELGLGTWTVRDNTTNADWCAAPVVDTGTMTVNLISVPQ